MTYDETLATRVRAELENRSDVAEKRMFGGVAFMVRDHMACGIVRASLMIRVDPRDSDTLLRQPHVRPMDFTGTPMPGFLFVDAEGLRSLPSLRKWVRRAVAFAETRPVKMAGKAKPAPVRSRKRRKR